MEHLTPPRTLCSEDVLVLDSDMASDIEPAIPTRQNFDVFIEDCSSETPKQYIAGGKSNDLYLPHLTKYGVGLKNNYHMRTLNQINIDGKILELL